MTRATLIRGARQLLTLCGESGPRGGSSARDLRIINDGAVLVIDGKIAEVGPSRRLERLAISRNADTIDTDARVVMPGLVDPCVSLLCGSARQTVEEESRELRNWTAQRMEFEARRRLRNFVRAGTCTMGASCGAAFDESSELKALRVLGAMADRLISVEPVFRAVTIPPEFEERPDEYTGWLASHLIPLIRGRRLAGAVETGDWPEVREAARQAGLPCRVRRTDGTVAAAGVTILAPGSGRPPSDGEAMALTTGFHATASPYHSMQTVLWMARRESAMTAEEAITAATINAAHALGVADRAGSLEPGKDADILILQTGDYRDLGWYLGTSCTAMLIRRGLEIFPRMESTQ